MTDTGIPTVEDMKAAASAAHVQEAPDLSPERLAANATANVFVTTIAEGIIQSLVNIMQQKEGGMTQEDLTTVYCLAALYGVEVEEEKDENADEEPAEGEMLDENGNPLEYEQATDEELEAAFLEAAAEEAAAEAEASESAAAEAEALAAQCDGEGGEG